MTILMIERAGGRNAQRRASGVRSLGGVGFVRWALKSHEALATARQSRKDDAPPSPAFTADLEGQVMSNKKHANEARKRSAHRTAKHP
jgi:hypothetical protein